VSQGSETASVLVDGEPVYVPLRSADQPVVVNAGGHGFYRVAYDDGLRGRLTGSAIRSLSTLERYCLVDDAWAATLSGRMSTADLLGFLGGFVEEREHAVWQAIVVSLRGVNRIVDDDAGDAFRRRVRDLAGPALADLGEPADGERDLTAKLRGLLTTTMGTLGRDQATIAGARKLFDRAATDPTAVDAELLSAATTIVATAGGSDEFDRMVDGYRNGSTPQEQLRHLNALAEFDDADLIRKVCDFAFSDDVKTQNAPFLLRLTIANQQHGDLAWEIVRSRWAEANERFPTNTIVRMIDSVSLLTRPEQVADVAAFFAEHPIEQAATTLDQILERQRVNAALRARESADLGSALSAGA
jgi:puromycin-sensitive aminopeptidase